MSASSMSALVESVTALSVAESLLLAAGDAAEARCERLLAARFYDAAAAVGRVVAVLHHHTTAVAVVPVLGGVA
jgi:hypothetical protein